MQCKKGGKLPPFLFCRKYDTLKPKINSDKGRATCSRFFVYMWKKDRVLPWKAEGLKRNLMDHLHLSGLEQVRIFVRYDVEGIDETTYLQARDTIFSEPNQDVVYEETLPDLSGWYVFGMEYLPGQYDQRADSAAQCIQILSQGEAPALRTAKIYALRGALPKSKSRR